MARVPLAAVRVPIFAVGDLLGRGTALGEMAPRRSTTEGAPLIGGLWCGAGRNLAGAASRDLAGAVVKRIEGGPILLALYRTSNRLEILDSLTNGTS